MGLMTSKSLMEVGVVRGRGWLEVWRGERGPEAGGLVSRLAVEFRRWLRFIDDSRVREPTLPSRAVTSGDVGGVTTNLGSNKLCKDLRGLIAALLGISSRSINGIGSSGDEEATIGAASASGEDTDEGVDDLVATSC